MPHLPNVNDHLKHDIHRKHPGVNTGLSSNRWLQTYCNIHAHVVVVSVSSRDTANSMGELEKVCCV